MNFQLLKLQIIYEVKQDSIKLPSFKGSTFRGAFGHALKSVACTCGKTLKHEETCPYGYIFDTTQNKKDEFLRNNDSVPRPFIFEPPMEEKEIYHYGDQLICYLTLIGNSISFFPLIIFALEEMGKNGIGQQGQKLLLKQVINLNRYGNFDKKIFETETRMLDNEPNLIQLPVNRNRQPIDQVTIYFKTPVRLKINGHYTNVPDFSTILRSAVRRITSLYYFHHDKQKLTVNFKELFEEAESVKLIESNISWYDWERYSNRQKERMKLGGIVGKATYAGKLEIFYPWLLMAEWTHIGKNPTFGLGKIKVASNINLNS